MAARARADAGRAAGAPEQLSAPARALLADAANDLLFSAASMWEIAIKRSLGRADFRVDPRLLRRGLLDNGYAELPVTSAHALKPKAVVEPSATSVSMFELPARSCRHAPT